MRIADERSHGFTLIELLTVIAIIAILAAIVIPTVSSVRVSAQKAKTKLMFNQWTVAMEQFKREYGYYPRIDNNTGRVQTRYFSGALTGKAPDGSAASTAELCGNKRRANFYTFAESDLTEGAPPVLQDTFGNTDIVVLYDVNGDGRITSDDGAVLSVSGAGGTLTPDADDFELTATSGIRAGVIFYSAGRGKSPSDIVYSWR